MPLSYGIKVSKKGFDVLTDTDPSHMAIWSKYPMLKVKSFNTGAVIIPNTTSNVTVTIPHGLSYIPIYTIYIENTPGSQTRYFLTSGFQPETDAQLPWEASADLTNIYINRNSFGSNLGTYQYAYYIFYDST